MCRVTSRHSAFIDLHLFVCLFHLDGEDGSGQKQKTKRVRTSFTEEQLRILHANFRIDSNPDGQDLERIAQQTGLSKRVTQVRIEIIFTLKIHLNTTLIASIHFYNQFVVPLCIDSMRAQNDTIQ
jgi:hypothetical protein